MILYPTETLYALGVYALNVQELEKLFELKGREKSKVSSWLVRNEDDIKHYAEVSDTAAVIMRTFLPGPLTLVLPVKSSVPREVISSDGTIGFRISSDPVAQRVIADFMEKHGAPLTCTSANVSGAENASTVQEILSQFGSRASLIDRVIDDGPRAGMPSTVVRVIGEKIEILREGAIGEAEIREALQ